MALKGQITLVQLPVGEFGINDFINEALKSSWCRIGQRSSCSLNGVPNHQQAASRV